MLCDKNEQTLGEIFRVDSNNYKKVIIRNLDLPTKIKAALFYNNINYLSDLLEISPQKLLEFRFIGTKSLQNIYLFLKDILKQDIAEKLIPEIELDKDKKLFLMLYYYRKAKSENLDSLEQALSSNKHLLDCYESSYQKLDNDFVLLCLEKPREIKLLFTVFEEFSRKNKIIDVLNNIPLDRKKSACLIYIKLYTRDTIKREKLLSFYSSDNSNIDSILDIIDLSVFDDYSSAIEFLNYCTYDLNSQIENIFENLYRKKYICEIIRKRSNNYTLKMIGEELGLSRERVRQLESVTIELFTQLITKDSIVEKIFVELNGVELLTLDSLKRIIHHHTEETFYLLKKSRIDVCFYNPDYDLFIKNGSDIIKRLEECVNKMPKLLESSEISSCAVELFSRNQIDLRYLFFVLSRVYRKKGEMYYRGNLSMIDLYSYILYRYFENGIKAYDSESIDVFKKILFSLVGDTYLPLNNHAFSSYIMRVGTIKGRGVYVSKRENRISKSLQRAIIESIEEQESLIIDLKTVYLQLTDRLHNEGIDNKLFFYGLVSEIIYFNSIPWKVFRNTLVTYVCSREEISNRLHFRKKYIALLNYDLINKAAYIHSESWKESHKAFCTREFVESHNVARQKAYILDKMQNGSRFFMLVDGKPVGIVSVNKNIIEDLYVLPSEQGKGYGTTLLKYAILHLEWTPTLWILENNYKAERFYLKNGFSKTGNVLVHENGINEIEYALMDKGDI
ncbi:MAG: GNAT family N-acetyltransferase [Clostridia bacterium]|nr:GNAT family N-acetyltransferase [Clostridia bacterium]